MTNRTDQVSAVSVAPFMLVGCASTLGVAAVFFGSHNITIGKAVLVLGFAGLSAASFLVPFILKARTGTLVSALNTLSLLQHRMADLEVVRREHFKSRTANEALVAKAGDLSSEMGVLGETVGKLVQAYERIETELLERRQATAALKRERDDWLARVTDFADAAHRALSLKDVDSRLVDAIAKQVQVLEGVMQPQGLTIIRPSIGDEFNEDTCEIVDEVTAEGTEGGRIVSCLEWGYVYRGELVRRAKVVVAARSTPQPARLTSPIDAKDTGAQAEA